MQLAAVRAGVLVLACAAACSGDPRDAPDDFAVQMLTVPAGEGSGQPFLAQGADSATVLSWLEPVGDSMQLRFATLGPEAWSQPRTVAAGANLFVNWADVPSVVPVSSDVWFAHWLVLVEGSFGAYDVVIAVSSDAGDTWNSPSLLNDDGTETEHGFATLFSWGDALGAVWLDGRQLAEWSFDRPDELLGVALRYARLSTDGRVLEQGEIDPLVCDCCQTDVAIASAGPIAIYRDRSEEEIRDVVVRRHDGRDWLAPVALGGDGWRIEGCPVNGPAIDAAGEHVVAAWFTAADNRPRVRFARSTNGGATFTAAQDIDSEGVFGQVDVALLEDGAAVVSWWRRAPAGGTALVVRTIMPDGAPGELRTIATNATPQPLDVPQMLRTDDALVLTWTDAASERVSSARVTGLP